MFNLKILLIFFIFLNISSSYASNIKNSAVVFMYHKFGVSKYPSTSIKIDQFDTHLKEFSNSLEKIDIECKLVFDADYADGFPSRNFGNWLKSDKKFENLIKEFNPDAIFVDRQRHFGLAATKTKIPLLVHLRGNYWEEIKMARETLYKSPPKRIALQKWEDIAEKCFQGSKIIFPICNFLSDVVTRRYTNKTVETLYQGISPSNWFKTDGMKLKHPCVGLLQSATIWDKTNEILILENILEQLLNSDQYGKNVATKKGESSHVEFAIKLPECILER